MKSIRIKDILSSEGDGRSISVEGWVRTRRDSKGIRFLEVNDGSTIKNLQVIIPESFEKYGEIGENVNNGASIRVTGDLVAPEGKGQSVELSITEIEIIGTAPVDEYPLQKKRHSFEFLREIAHLRPRTNTFGAVARVRNAMSYAVHRYFQENGFIYVNTPVISGSDCEGAGEMFQVTTLIPNDAEKMPAEIDYSRDFFGKRAYLTVSGQLEGETYACALKNIYTFGPTFRAENSNTSRHLAEFWMIEPEMAFCDINLNMDIAEDFLKFILRDLLEKCPDDMDFFNSRIQKGLIENIENIISESFNRISYTEAVDILLKSGKKFEYPVEWGLDLQSEHEKFLTETVYKRPVIITDYPREIKAFYMKLNPDGKTVRGMDVLVPRLGEIIGGSERETDKDKLIERIEESGLNGEEYWWYIDLRKYGNVPHSGFGLGFERLIQFVTGMQNIRDVIPYPRCVKTLEF